MARRGAPAAAFDPDEGGVLRLAVRDRLERRPQRDPRPPPAEGAIRSLVPGDDHAAADTTDATEKAECVAAALAALPDHYEAVLRAKYLDRLTVDEIATGRGESPKAVESLLSRARQAFREAYEKHHELTEPDDLDELLAPPPRPRRPVCATRSSAAPQRRLALARVGRAARGSSRRSRRCSRWVSASARG